MPTQNSSNQKFSNDSDGFTLGGGTTQRNLTVTGSNVTLSGSGSNTYNFPASADTLVGRASTDTLTNKTLTSPVINTSVSGSAVATVATASTLALRDSNANITTNSFIPGVTTTAASAGTTVMDITHSQVQIWTGTSTQTIRLPTTSVVAGQTYTIINQSSAALTIQSSAAGAVATLGAGRTGVFMAVVSTPTTGSHWSALSQTSGTRMIFPTTDATLARTDAAQTFTGVQTFSSAPSFGALPTGAGVASAATASTLAARDANANLSANAIIPGFTTTPTAAGTTVLTVASTGIQVFTGSTTQTLRLPTTSIAAGAQYMVINNSSGAVTVQSSDTSTVTTMAASTTATFTSLVATPTTAANWSSSYVSAAGDVTGPASSVDSEVALFSGTSGKTLKRATTTGIAKLTSGVLSAGIAGTDYVTPTGSETLTNKTISGASNTITGITGILQPVRVGAETGLTYTISAGTVTQIAGTTIAGVSVAIGDRILIVGAPASTGVGVANSNQPGNGIYVVTGNTTNITLSRTADMSGSVKPFGLTVYIAEGASWGGWYATFGSPSSGTFTWGTDPLQYTGYWSPSSLQSVVYKTSTDTLTNKTLTSPKIANGDHIADANGNELISFGTTPSAANHFSIVNGAAGQAPQIYATGSDTNVGIYMQTKGTGSFALADGNGNSMLIAARTASAVNYLQVQNAATGNAPFITAAGSDTNINLNLIPKGGGVVQANGVEVATVAGTARLVCSTQFGGTGTEDGANTWAKILTYSTGTNQFATCELMLAVTNANSGSVDSAIISVFFRSNSTSSNPTIDVKILSASGDSIHILKDSFKVISGGWSTNMELWAKKGEQWGAYNFYEISRNVGGSGTLTYSTNPAWQSATPSGAVNNITTDGVTAFGAPVATTTDTQTLTNKTISGTNNTITNIPMESIVTANNIMVGYNNTFDSNITGWTVASGTWSHDSSTGRAANGSAKLVANGTQGEIASPTVPVVEGTTYLFEVWVSGSGITNTTGDIDLWVEDYTGATLNGQWLLDGWTTGWPSYNNIPASFGWRRLFGQFQASAGIDGFRMVFNVDAAVSAGNIYFDDARITPIGITKEMVAGLGDEIDDIWDGAGTFADKTLNNSNTVTLLDTNFTLQDDADTTKTVKFNLSSIGSGNAVTLNVPNVTGSNTLVTRNSVDILLNKTLTNPTETQFNIGTVTTSYTLDIANGTVQTATLTASTACTFTMPAAAAGKSFTFMLKQAAATGNGSATFTNVRWNSVGAPTITATAGKMDILSFFSDGTNWYGSYTQGYTP